MMLPPIHKQVSVGSSGKDATGKRESTGVALQDRVEAELTSGGRGASLFAERLLSLERDNEQMREEIQHLRQMLSNNQSSRDDKGLLGKISEELNRAVHAFNAKAQADAFYQQREHQKAALLFAEVARVGCFVEGLDVTLRSLGEDTRRRLDKHEHELAQLSSLSGTFGATRTSPTKRSIDEFHRHNEEVQWIKQALTQLRSELESDRNERWKEESERSQWIADLRASVVKTEATMDTRIASHLERVHNKLVADKMEIVHTLDEYRELMTGSDFKRMSSQVAEFSRINDHLHALERWIHSEHGKIKQVLQSMQTEHEGHFQTVVGECVSILKLLSGVLQQQDDDWRLQLGILQEAITDITVHVQRKIFALEEAVPMEVKARQAHDEKIRQRLEYMIKSLTRAIEAARDDAVALVALNRSKFSPEAAAVAAETALLQTRLAALEQAHDETIRRMDEQLKEVKQSQVQSTDGDHRDDQIPLVSDAVGTDTTGVIKDFGVATQSVALNQHVTELLQPFVEELTERQNELLTRLENTGADQAEAIMSLQRWSATHAEECRQCYEYTQWTLTESAVQQTVDRLVDGVLWMALGKSHDFLPR